MRALLFLSVVACSSRPAATPCTESHAAVIVRHAEKKQEGGKDPDLADQGVARAQRLATTLGHAPVSRLIASEYKRTQQTLQPLAEKKNVKIEVKPTDDLARELKQAPNGSLTVVATHSNVIPKLVRDLGGKTLSGVAPDATALADTDYDRMIVVSFACDATSVLELHQP